MTVLSDSRSNGRHPTICLLNLDNRQSYRHCRGWTTACTKLNRPAQIRWCSVKLMLCEDYGLNQISTGSASVELKQFENWLVRRFTSRKTGSKLFRFPCMSCGDWSPCRWQGTCSHGAPSTRKTVLSTRCFLRSSLRTIELISFVLVGETYMQQAVCVGINGDVQPILVVIELDHSLVDRNMIRGCVRVAVTRPSELSYGPWTDTDRHPGYRESRRFPKALIQRNGVGYLASTTTVVSLLAPENLTPSNRYHR